MEAFIEKSTQSQRWNVRLYRNDCRSVTFYEFEATVWRYTLLISIKATRISENADENERGASPP
jgi:hypothetical protein